MNVAGHRAGMDVEARGEMGCDAVQGCGAAKEPFLFLFWGETDKFGKSPFNFLKTPQQLEADHQLGWFTSNTLK